MAYLGIDIGGTNTVVAIVDDAYRILASEQIKTAAPGGAAALCGEIAAAAEGLYARSGVPKSSIVRAGAGCPGLISDGVCHFAGNLEFSEVPLAALLSEQLELPVTLCNDADAAAFGEHVAGCGRGRQSLVMLTIGTGIGGGVVIDDKIYTGAFGFGVEVGHFVIHAGGRRCSCGGKGCLEAYCSATALIRDTRTAMLRNRSSRLWALCPSPGDVDGRAAFWAAAQGDPTAKRVLQNFTNALGIGVYNLIVLFQPDVLCIGGGMSQQEEALLAPVRDQIRAHPLGQRIGRQVEIKAAALHGDAGVIGAAAWARKQTQAHENPPRHTIR